MTLVAGGAWWYRRDALPSRSGDDSPPVSDTTALAKGDAGTDPSNASSPEQPVGDNGPNQSAPIANRFDAAFNLPRTLIATEPTPDEGATRTEKPKDPAPSDNAVVPASDPTVHVRPVTPETGLPANAVGGAKPQAGVASSDRIEAAWRKYQSGDKVAARHELNALLARSTSLDEQRRLREYLSKIANEMIFSPARTPNDPLVDEYVIQPGDVLIRISKKVGLPYELLMSMNGITDAGRIRPDQRLKIVRGPFHARISKSDFRMDLYCGDLYVRSYRVGLGKLDSTPEGGWKVKEKLTNPTFFPPPSYEDKRIIDANDPRNPLGEHWIALEGTDAATKDQQGFGIHGTIEPDSIGKAASHGCVRMHNEDVAFVYSLLTPGQSTVTILP